MRWVMPVLFVLLALGALRALLGTSEPEPVDYEAAASAPAGDAAEDADAPRLAVPAAPAGGASPRRAPTPAAQASGASRLPPAVQALLGRMWEPDAGRAVWTWVRAERERLRDLLAARLPPRPNRWNRDGGAVRTGQALVEAWQQAGIHVDLQADVAALLAEPYGNGPVELALLGVLTALPVGDPPPWDLLRTLALDPERHAPLRVQAAAMLLAEPRSKAWPALDVARPVTEADGAVVAAVLPLSRRPSQHAPLVTLLRTIHLRPDVLTAVLPALVEATRLRLGWQAEQELYRCLLAAKPRTPAIRGALARAWAGGSRNVRREVSAAVFPADEDPEATLAWLGEAPATVRIEAVLRLRERGVAVERLHPHLLAVLASGVPRAAERAVGAIPLLRVPDADALAAIEPLLRAEQLEHNLVGVKALGMLASVPGDHEAAILRLFTVSRRASPPRVRIAAVQSILMHTGRPAMMIEGLSGLLGDTEAQVRREAVDALGELAGEHAAARRALEGARNDDDQAIRDLIAYWLDESEDDD